jgi:hypothetical protein
MDFVVVVVIGMVALASLGLLFHDDTIQEHAGCGAGGAVDGFIVFLFTPPQLNFVH